MVPQIRSRIRRSPAVALSPPKDPTDHPSMRFTPLTRRRDEACPLASDLVVLYLSWSARGADPGRVMRPVGRRRGANRVVLASLVAKRRTGNRFWRVQSAWVGERRAARMAARSPAAAPMSRAAGGRRPGQWGDDDGPA